MQSAFSLYSINSCTVGLRGAPFQPAVANALDAEDAWVASLRSSRVRGHQYLSPHKAFELGLGELDRLVYRFALLRALGDHFADGALREHLRAEARWRRIASEQSGHIAARWIIV